MLPVKLSLFLDLGSKTSELIERVITIAVAMMGRAIERKKLKSSQFTKLIKNEAKKLRAKTIIFSKSTEKSSILPN